MMMALPSRRRHHYASRARRRARLSFRALKTACGRSMPDAAALTGSPPMSAFFRFIPLSPPAAFAKLGAAASLSLVYFMLMAMYDSHARLVGFHRRRSTL